MQRAAQFLHPRDAVVGCSIETPGQYLRNLVVARVNPVRWHRAKKDETEPPMAIGPALTRMHAAARRFDAAQVRETDLALVAAVAGDED